MSLQLAITFSILSFLDCWFVELSLKPLWRTGTYRRDAVRWYQIALFGSVFAVAIYLQDDGQTLEVLKFTGLCALWLIAGVEDALYYFWLPLFEWIRGVRYFDEFEFHYLWIWKIPKELPWLGRHTGKWAWTSNWWLYGLSKFIFQNKNVSAYSVIVSVVLTVILTLRYF